MKKVQILFIILAVVSIAFASCKKSNYCAACVEAHSGYKPSDFCGTEAEVDTYISELISQGSAAGQSWSCSKN